MAKSNTKGKAPAAKPELSRWSRVQRCFQSQTRVPPRDLTDEETNAFAALVSPQGEFHPEIRVQFAGLWDRYVARKRQQQKQQQAAK